VGDKPGDAQCLDPPNGYKISGEGAVASFAKGSATVKASERDGGTLVAQVSPTLCDAPEAGAILVHMSRMRRSMVRSSALMERSMSGRTTTSSRLPPGCMACFCSPSLMQNLNIAHAEGGRTCVRDVVGKRLGRRW
jgi:hypothetical protein